MNTNFIIIGLILGYCGSIPIRVLIRQFLKKHHWKTESWAYPRGLGGPDDGPGVPQFVIIISALLAGVAGAYIAQEILNLEVIPTMIIAFAGGLITSDLTDAFHVQRNINK